jgi:hypothetical protein
MKMKKNDITAIEFYQEIQDKKELDKYKLVNGLFIVKYTSEDECYHVGDFLKKGSASNTRKINIIALNKNDFKQKFYKKTLTHTGLGWKELNIKFIEKPIKEILK